MNKIGMAIKYYREVNKLTQKKLSEMTHIDPASICQYEKGTRQPSIDVILLISEKLDIDVKKLLDPHESIWREECVEEIVEEMSFLKEHDYFIKKVFSKATIFFYFRSPDESNASYHIQISKKLSSVGDFCFINRKSLLPVSVPSYQFPDWFTNLGIEARMKFLDMRYKKNMLKDTYPLINFLIRIAILKQDLPYYVKESEENKMMKMYKEQSIISSTYPSIMEEIQLLLKRYDLDSMLDTTCFLTYKKG